VLRWLTFLEGLKSDFARITRTGVALRYDGIFISRGDPGIDNYVRILPGETISGAVDLSTAYHISDPGDYDVSFILSINDAFEEGDATPPRKKRDHRGTRIIRQQH
jgi:hypothetical protein